MADDKKKKKKKAPPVLTPEQRRELAEKQVIGAGMALDFRDQAHFYNRAAELLEGIPDDPEGRSLLRRKRLRRRNTVPRRRRSPRTAGRLPMKLRWRPRRLR